MGRFTDPQTSAGKLNNIKTISNQGGNIVIEMDNGDQFNLGPIAASNSLPVKFSDGTTGDITTLGVGSGLTESVNGGEVTLNAQVSDDDLAKLRARSVTHIAITGDEMTVTHGDGAAAKYQLPTGGAPGQPSDTTALRNEITFLENTLTSEGKDINGLKQQFGRYDHEMSTVEGASVWRGTAAPIYPDDAKHSYYWTFHDTPAREAIEPVPNPTNGPLVDGTLLYVANQNKEATVRLEAQTGQNIDGATSYTVQPNTFAVLVLTGVTWNLIESGYIPDSLFDLTNRILSQAQQEGLFDDVANEHQGGLKLFLTEQERDQFTQVAANKKYLYRSVCLVVTNTDAVSQWFYWSGTKTDGTDGAWKQLKEDSTQPTASGITLKDQQVEAAGITEIEIQPPLKFEVNSGESSKASAYIDQRAYEEQHAASCLLQLDSVESVEWEKARAIYLSHEVIPTGEYYSLNPAQRGLNVQDNTGGDAAVTGGELTRIMASVGFLGNAPSNGNIKIWIKYKDPASPLPAGILHDVNGDPMLVERYYEAGASLSEPLVIAGAMMATGNSPIILMIETSFNADIALDQQKTLMAVEQFNDGYETSIAAIEFQRRLGISIIPEIRQFKQSMFSLKDELAGVTMPQVLVEAGKGGDVLNEFGVKAITDINVKVENDLLTITDNNDIADFYVDISLDNVETQMLRGKQIRYSVTLQDINDAFRVEVYKFTGTPNPQGEIYNSRNNDSLVLNEGYSLVASNFVSENALGGFTEKTYTTTVPDDANNIYIIIRPVSAQQPITLVVKDFDWGSVNNFKGYVEIARSNLNEQYLAESDEYAEFIMDNRGYKEIRYTIGTTQAGGYPMPVGRFAKGNAPIKINNSLNKVPTSQDPQNDGVYEFEKDAEALPSVTWLVRNEGSEDVTVTFSSVLYPAQATEGQETEIPESVKSFTVPANTPAPGIKYTIPAYSILVETGQAIGYRAKADKAGAYVQSDSSTQLLQQTVFDFKELSDQSDAPADADTLRAAFLTQSPTEDAKQTLSADGVPEVIQFNDLQLASPHITFNQEDNTFTFLENEDFMFSISAQVLRELTGAQVDWVVFAETSADNGATWQPVDGSARIKTIGSANANRVDFIDFTAPIRATAGLKFRFSHATDNASKQVSIISKAPNLGAPSSAGVIAGFYGKG